MANKYVDPFSVTAEGLNPFATEEENKVSPFMYTQEEEDETPETKYVDPFTVNEEGINPFEQEAIPEENLFKLDAEEGIGRGVDPFSIYEESDYDRDTSLIQKIGKAASKGYSKGAIGLITGSKEDNRKIDSFLGHVVELGSELASDAPAFAGGGALGAVIGGAIGSVVPVLGTAVGAGLGSAFFGMALPTIIKSSFGEYRGFVKKGGKSSYGDYIESVGRIVKEGGKSGAVGLVTANMGRLIPVLKKIPVWKKLLGTTIGRKVTAAGLELTGLTGAQALIEGEIPTGEQLLDNTILLAGMRIAHRFGAPIKNLIPESVRTARRRLVQKLPTRIQKPILSIMDYSKDIKSEVANKEYFDWLREHVGERESKMVAEQFSIKRKGLKRNEKGDLVPKFTPKELEDSIYLRQRTGNPNIEGDTYAKVKSRSSKELQHYTDVVVDDFFKNQKKLINADERLKSINPRDEIKDRYLPGLWEGDTSKIKINKNFSLKNAFADRKVFNTIAEAAREAGLKPRFNNIQDFMAAYSDITVKMLADSKLVDHIEKVNAKENLIVRSHEGEKHRKAKKLGYVPFEDSFLKRYKGIEEYIGKEVKSSFQFEEKKDLSIGEKYLKGKYKIRPGEDVYRVKEVPKVEYRVKWKTAEGPVLVHPAFAKAFQGVFNKNIAKPEHKAWQAYDNLANVIRFSWVAFSPFHYGSVFESAMGALKTSEVINLKGLMRNGEKLLNSESFMVDAVKNGVTFKGPIEYRKGGRLVDKMFDSIAKQVGNVSEQVFNSKKAVETGSRGLKKVYNYLFDTFHPTLKAVTYNELVNKELMRNINEGKKLSKSETTTIKRDIADFVNNIYGGQNWETAKFFNNKETMKLIRRFIAYPDWTISALKQAGMAGQSGFKGKMGRRYWAKYIINMSLIQGTLKYLFGGIEQKDKRNNSIRGLGWSKDKAAKEFWKGDPSKWYMFPLPDVNVKIGNSIFNPGRGTNERKLYGHFGKQALEILGWGTKPFQTFFGKSNPIFQLAFQQLLGGTPYEEKLFPTRGKYKHGEFRPWDATEPYTVGRAVSRGKALVQGVTPFSLSTLTQRGIGPYIGSAGGLFPVSQGMSLRKAEKFVTKALKDRNYNELRRLRKILLDNGYKQKSIKGLITKMKRRININKLGR